MVEPLHLRNDCCLDKIRSGIYWSFSARILGRILSLGLGIVGVTVGASLSFFRLCNLIHCDHQSGDRLAYAADEQSVLPAAVSSGLMWVAMDQYLRLTASFEIGGFGQYWLPLVLEQRHMCCAC